MLNVNHLGGDGNEVSQGPGISGESKSRVVSHVPNSAGEDDQQRQECEPRGTRLAAEDGVGDRDEERGEGSEDDEGIDVGVTEEVGVGEDREVEDEGGGEELLGGLPGEGVVVEEPYFAEEPDADGGG